MGQLIQANSETEKVLSIVRIFETGRAKGDHGSLAVLDDGAGISYGVMQFTHRSGALFEVAAEYLRNGGAVGSGVIAARMPLLKKTSTSAVAALAADSIFKKALRAAALTREMREAQDAVAFRRYLRPAIDAKDALGFELPLSLAVICDSVVHGSWERMRAAAERAAGRPARNEKEWIKVYVKLRDRWLRSVPRLAKTAYRTSFFLSEISRGNWELALPLSVNGVVVRASDLALRSGETEPSQTLNFPPETHPTGRDRKVAAPAQLLDDIEAGVNAAAEKIDQAERIVTTVGTRTDKAKSLWTTVAGTALQMAWAIGGLAAGLPREVWVVVAITAAALTLMFLYRQIVLGRIREESGR